MILIVVSIILKDDIIQVIYADLSDDQSDDTNKVMVCADYLIKFLF